MYWYNPTTHTSERVDTPSGEEEAIRMLAGHPDSATFVSEEYAELRRSGTPIERALVSVGHEEWLRGAQVHADATGGTQPPEQEEVEAECSWVRASFGDEPRRARQGSQEGIPSPDEGMMQNIA